MFVFMNVVERGGVNKNDFAFDQIKNVMMIFLSLTNYTQTIYSLQLPSAVLARGRSSASGEWVDACQLDFDECLNTILRTPIVSTFHPLIWLQAAQQR